MRYEELVPGDVLLWKELEASYLVLAHDGAGTFDMLRLACDRFSQHSKFHENLLYTGEIPSELVSVIRGRSDDHA